MLVSNTNPQRLANVDALRGLAAMAVAWFHFTNGNPNFLAGGGVTGMLKASGQFGWLGVEVFFVISGFVLPLALHAANFQTKYFRFFLVKRLLRLEPPYLVSIVLVLVLGWLSTKAPGFAGQPFSFDGLQVASHIGYLTSLMGYPWLNPVYWTLAIELQFYLLVGLSFGLLMSPRLWVRAATLSAWLACSVWVTSGLSVMHLLGFFALGSVTTWLRVGLISQWPYVATTALIATLVFATQGLPATIAGLGAAWGIAWVRVDRIPGLCWLGTVSYSLYLLHVPIGGRVINLGARFADQPWSQLVVLGVAVAVSILAAWLLYLFVEKPAVSWAARVSYKPSRLESTSLG